MAISFRGFLKGKMHKFHADSGERINFTTCLPKRHETCHRHEESRDLSLLHWRCPQKRQFLSGWKWCLNSLDTHHSTIHGDELSFRWAVLSYLKLYFSLMSPGISLCPLTSVVTNRNSSHNLPYPSEFQKHFLTMQMTVVCVAREVTSLPPWSSKTPRGGSAHPALGGPAGAKSDKLFYTPCATNEKKLVTLEG